MMISFVSVVLCLFILFIASNRQALRDSVAIVELVNIIANSSLGDIHGPSVHVIANLFEDFDTLQVT